MDCLQVLLRRLEELKLEGSGFTKAEIFKQVGEKFGCRPRIIYNDFQTRANWQPMLQGAINSQDLILKILNRYEQIYRMASVLRLSSTNPAVQLGALNTMLKVNSSIFEIAALPLISQFKEKLPMATTFEADPMLREALLESIVKQKAEKVERDAAKISDASRC